MRHGRLWWAIIGKALIKGRRPVCTGHGSAAARRAGAVLLRRRPPVPNVCRWRPRRPRRPVWVGLRTARATTQSSRDRPGATGSQGSSGPHRTSRCAASPSGTVLWRRSVWASSRCVSSASPSRPRTGSPASWTTSSTICTGGWTTPKPRMIGPGPTSPSPRCLPRPVCSARSVLPAAYSAPNHAMVAWLSLEALRIWLEHGPGRHRARPGRPRRPRRCGARGDYAAGYVVRADRKRTSRDSAGPGRAGRRWRAGHGRLHLPRGRVPPAGLRANAGQLRRRGGGGAGLCAPDR